MSAAHQPDPRAPPSRMSIFREGTMPVEYSPANTIREEEDVHQRGGNSRSSVRLLLQLVNGVAHLAVCVVLLVVMAQFLIRYDGTKRRFVTK